MTKRQGCTCEVFPRKYCVIHAEAPPMQGDGKSDLERIMAEMPPIDEVTPMDVFEALTAAEARGYERGIEDAALEVERQTTMHREKIAAAIRSLRRNKDA